MVCPVTLPRADYCPHGVPRWYRCDECDLAYVREKFTDADGFTWHYNDTTGLIPPRRRWRDRFRSWVCERLGSWC